MFDTTKMFDPNLYSIICLKFTYNNNIKNNIKIKLKIHGKLIFILNVLTVVLTILKLSMKKN